jgi:hypothetical protein
VYSDHERPVVRVLDLDTGKVTHTFRVPKPRASLATTDGGRFVVILTGDDKGTVRILDTGLVFEAHGDHRDVEKRDVRMLKLALTGDRPAHVLSGHGHTSVFYDGPRQSENKGSAKAVLLDHTRLARDRTIFLSWTSSHRQHGLAVPLGEGLWAMSNPNPAYVRQEPNASSLATGLGIVDATRRWEQIATFDNVCPEMHGHASRGEVHVFGCGERSSDNAQSGSLLLLDPEAEKKWSMRTLAYPDDRRVSTLKSGGEGRLVVGNYGKGQRYDALIRIDVDAKSLATDADVFPIPDNQAVCQFEVTEDGRRVFNLLADGTLRLYALSPAWKEVARIDAVSPFDCAFGATTPRPTLGVDGESAYVSDPAKKQIREFAIDGLKLRRDLRVGGVPEKLAVGGFAH